MKPWFEHEDETCAQAQSETAPPPPIIPGNNYYLQHELFYTVIEDIHHVTQIRQEHIQEKCIQCPQNKCFRIKSGRMLRVSNFRK